MKRKATPKPQDEAKSSSQCWTPQIKPGGIYCSPACGFNCTRVAYDRAVVEAAALATQMGEGWYPKVWENGGWHFKASKGCATMDANLKGSAISGVYEIEDYTVFINSSIKQVVVLAPTAYDALSLALAEARQQISQWTHELNDITLR